MEEVRETTWWWWEREMMRRRSSSPPSPSRSADDTHPISFLASFLPPGMEWKGDVVVVGLETNQNDSPHSLVTAMQREEEEEEDWRRRDSAEFEFQTKLARNSMPGSALRCAGPSPSLPFHSQEKYY